MRDLERPQELRLSLALALLGRPRLLGVDDIDMKLSDAERAEAWDLLRSLTRAGTTVVAVCRTAPEDCVTVPTEPENPEPEPGKPAPGKPEPKKEEAGDALTEAGRA